MDYSSTSLMRRFLLAGCLSIATILFIGSKLNNSQLFMPAEYKIIKKITSKLAKFNYLGDRSVSFSITPGNIAYWRAKEIGLCSNEGNCNYFSSLNPYKRYRGRNGEELNELIRQSYVWGIAQGRAYPSGTISIYKSTFKVLRGMEAYLACLIAHELAHTIKYDPYEASIKSFDLDEDKHEKLYAKYSRDMELKADLKATEMIINAGYPDQSCLEAVIMTSKINGNQHITKENDLHPSFAQRISNLKKFKSNKKLTTSVNNQNVKLKWRYNAEQNNLTFTPKK